MAGEMMQKEAVNYVKIKSKESIKLIADHVRDILQ
jgi:hypothetical protein